MAVGQHCHSAWTCSPGVVRTLWSLVFTPASRQAHLMRVRATSQQRRVPVAVGGTSEFSSCFCCTSFCFHRDNSRAGLPYSCGWISPLARSLMPPGGRRAAVNAVLWFFWFLLLFSLCRKSKREFALHIPHITTEQGHRCDVCSRDAVVCFWAT